MPSSTTLFGRSEELRSITALLADESVRLVSLTGRAGVGKTRLALEVGRALQEQDERLVCFVSLASLATANMVFVEIASQLGLGGLSEASPASIARRLRGDGYLLVLDNFEHVLDAASALADLLERCDGLQILATSQSPLRLRFERVVRVPPLPLPDSTYRKLAELEEQPAIALYCERVRAVDDRFRLDQHNADAVAALCRQLEGLPLAIELAAARAVTLPAGEVARRISDGRLDVLHAERVDGPERHRNLRGAIEWTYQLLGQTERQLLLGLAIVGGAFDADDAEALSADDSTPVLDVLSELVDLHLVEPLPVATGIPRFELLLSIREFAYEKLGASGQLRDLQDRWIRWLAGRARSAAVGLDASGPDPWWHWVDEAETVLAGAVGVCLQLGRAEEACDLLSALAPLWNAGSFTLAHRRLMDEVIELAERQTIATASYDDALLWSALLHMRRFDVDSRQRGLRQLQRVRELAGESGDDRLRLRLLYFETLVARLTGDMVRASAASSEGSTLAQACGSQLWSARFEVQSGMIAQEAGDEAQVVDLGLSALAGARRMADGRTLLLAAVVLLPWGQKHPEIRRSLPQPTELRSLARSIHQSSIEVLLVTQLAMEAAFHGDIDVAAQYGSDALSLSGEQEFSSYSACGLVVAAHVATALGDHTLAARIHGRFGDAIEAAMPQMYRRDYRKTIDLLRRSLGPVAFDSARGAGARVSWSSTVGEAQEYLRGVCPAEQGRRSPAEERPGAGGSLTVRQLEVVNLLASGLTNREIADRLGVTTKTVMHHTGAIYGRLGVRGRSETVAWALREGHTVTHPPRS